MRNRNLWTVVIGLHVAAAMAAGGCQISLGVKCGEGWCSDQEICVDSQAAQPVCIRSTCGNGQVDLGEECDDGNLISGDGCSPYCMVERCGDGILEFGEKCDDGNALGGDGCSARCTIEICGNGILDREHGEQCDDGNAIDGDGCTASCMLPTCGNGKLEIYEQCDDGNTIDGDGCSSGCTIEMCGNGILDRARGEQCDDGNTIDGDGWEAGCRLPSCGNGITERYEQCDDGNTGDGDGCSAGCTIEVCGNAILDPGEQCDDGNTIDGDGCEARCKVPVCGNRILDRAAGEQCDDGNTRGGDGCSASCTIEVCGNRILDPGEQCDDGNTASGDGCSFNCTFEHSDNTIGLLAYLKGFNTGAGDSFGWSVALSADGSTLAVGGISESSSGAVYVFTRSGTTWVQQAYLKAFNPDAGDVFGWSVALSADGSTLAVGAIGESSAATGIDGDPANNSAVDAGAVYVFARSGTTWSQQAYVKASNTDVEDEFGTSVALSADGSTLVVGAALEDSAATGIDGDQADNSADFAGAVYVFTRSGTTWSQQAYLKASNADALDVFGTSVALSADGSILAVGARGEASAATGIGGNQADNSATQAGAVYVFTRSGTTWSQQVYIKASNTGGADLFGFGVALAADGSTLAVGAIQEASAATGIGGNQANNSTLAAGAVYVFTRSGTTWSQQAYIKASNTGVGDEFGRNVALAADGSTLAVAAPGESSGATGIGGNQADNSASEAGAVYVFTRSGATWSQQAYVKASNTDAGDQFGLAVALSGDGTTLAVGAPQEAGAATGIGGDQASNSAALAGAVYLFY